MDFRALTWLNQPDLHIVNDFRKRHVPALSDLFVQVLSLCQRAGPVKLGHVEVDDTKLRANASRHKAMSDQRMVTEEPKLAAEVRAWLDEAEAADQAEDAQHGRDRRGDEMSDWAANKQRRLECIGQAKAQLEADEASDPAMLDSDGPGPSSAMQQRGVRKTTLLSLTRASATRITSILL